MYELTELDKWEKRAMSHTTDMLNSFNQLKENPLETILASKNNWEFWDLERLHQSLPHFIPLNAEQIKSLVSTSDHFGIPLLPTGLMTFTSAEYARLQLAIDGFYGSDEDGSYSPPSRFSHGILSRTGLWSIQSPQASAFTSSEFDRLSEELEDEQEVPKVPSQFFPPTKEELSTMEEYITHEGYHGAEKFNFNFNKLRGVEVKLLKEGLAYRTGLHLKTRTKKDIQRILNSYNYRKRRQLAVPKNQLNKFIDTISCTDDVNYQAELSWRGIGAHTLQTFLDPSIELIRFAKEMSQYAKSILLPYYKQNLLTSSNS